MARSIIKKANTVEEAIDMALQEFNLDIDNVDVEVLGNEDSFSVVKVTEHIKDETKVAALLDNFLKYIGVEATMDFSKPDDETIKVDISGENLSGVIGKSGDTLYALSYLCSVAVNKDRVANFKKVIVDCEHYRENKKQKLIDLANSTAERVCKYRRPIQMKPMPAAERKIVHEALQANRLVETESYGVEPARCVVVRLKPYTKVI